MCLVRLDLLAYGHFRGVSSTSRRRRSPHRPRPQRGRQEHDPAGDHGPPRRHRPRHPGRASPQVDRSPPHRRHASSTRESASRLSGARATRTRCSTRRSGRFSIEAIPASPPRRRDRGVVRSRLRPRSRHARGGREGPPRGEGRSRREPLRCERRRGRGGAADSLADLAREAGLHSLPAARLGPPPQRRPQGVPGRVEADPRATHAPGGLHPAGGGAPYGDRGARRVFREEEGARDEALRPRAGPRARRGSASGRTSGRRKRSSELSPRTWRGSRR